MTANWKIPYDERTFFFFFLVLVLEGLLGLHRIIQLQLLWHQWLGTDLDYYDYITITLPTKVRLVKAMVFPAVMYGCESWTIKKAEH